MVTSTSASARPIRAANAAAAITIGNIQASHAPDRFSAACGPITCTDVPNAEKPNGSGPNRITEGPVKKIYMYDQQTF